MAAYTANTTGPWNVATTWSNAGVPGSGDTGTINTGVTVTIPDGYTATIGTTGGTTGTTALTITAAGKLVIGQGASGQLNLQGDITPSGNTNPGAITIAAGGQLRFVPASGQRVKVGFNSGWTFAFNGSSSARCSVLTDPTALAAGGLKGYFSNLNPSGNGLTTAAYTDFADLDDGSSNGFFFSYWSGSGQGTTIDHCTFTRCAGLRLSWASVANGVTSITNSVWSGTVGTNFGNGASLMRLSQPTASTGGTRVITGNVFDMLVETQNSVGLTVTGNVFSAALGAALVASGSAGGTIGATWGTFDSNLVAMGGGGTSSFIAYGDVTNCLVMDGHASNPQYGHANAYTNSTWSGNVFESYNGSNDGQGDIIHSFTPATAGVTLAFTKNISLPTYGTNSPAGTMTIYNVTPAGQCTIEHNTIYCGAQAGCNVDESSGGEAAGAIVSLRANLLWNGTEVATSLKLHDVATSGTRTTDIVSPTNADYNGSYLLHTETPSPGTSFTDTGRGYNANFSAVPGAHDVDGTNPLFVDSTRCVSQWWIQTQGGATSGNLLTDTNAAIAYIATNPATYIPACLAWIKAGYRPQATAYQAASYPGDTSTTDAAGNAWPGGAPGIGAMGYLAPATTVFNSAVMMGC
jgi:hypothetical protein